MKEKYKVETFTPEVEIAETAENRTRGIVRRWGIMRNATLNQLAISLYLQGIEDATKVIYQSNGSWPLNAEK